jgi:hypothetical protein
MLGRRRAAADSNASTAVVPVFGVDPHGASIFAGAVRGTMGQLGSRVVMDTRATDWTGWVQSPQNFRASGAITGTARAAGVPRVERTAYIDQVGSSSAVSPVQALMQARAARGRY